MNIPSSTGKSWRFFAVVLLVFLGGAVVGGFAWRHFDAGAAEARLVLRGLARFETQRNEAVRVIASSPDGAIGAQSLSVAGKTAIAAAYEVAFQEGTRILHEELASARSLATGLSLEATRVAVERSTQAGEVRIALPRIVFDVVDIEAFPVLVASPSCRRRVLFVDGERCAPCRAALAALIEGHSDDGGSAEAALPPGETCIHHVVVPQGGADALATSRLAFCLGREAPAALRLALVSSATLSSAAPQSPARAALRLAAERAHESLLARPSERDRVDACVASADVGGLLVSTARPLHAAALHAPALVSNVSAFSIAAQRESRSSLDAAKEDVLAWLLQD